MAGGGFMNSDGRDNFLTGDIVVKTEDKMEASTWLAMFCEKLG